LATGFGHRICRIPGLSWLPIYLLNIHGLDLLHVGLYASGPGVAGILGMLTGGWLADAWFA
jgi:sugar phosphate permease